MSRNWLVGGLVVSVVLNLVLVGFVAGRLSFTGAPAGGRMDPTMGYVRLLRFLPEERRETLAPIVRPLLREMMPELRTLRADHRAVQTALAAEPFDPEALSKALEDLRRKLNSGQEKAHATLVELAGALTPAERLQLAEAMQRRPPRRPGGAHVPPPPP